MRNYYEKDFTYIELGDGIELWENLFFNDIFEAHKNTFLLLREFYLKNKLHMLWGNHDMVFRDPKTVEKLVRNIFSPKTIREKQALFDLQYHESILLQIENTKKKILLIHGHQADILNYKLWKLSRFFVRYIWMPLQI